MLNDNPVTRVLLGHRSIREFVDREPDEDTIETIARAGQQAAFAYQLGSVVLSRTRERHPFKAPLLFTVCVDLHRMELVMARRGWRVKTCDLAALMLGIQDACYMAQNMVIAAEALGLGTCYIGVAPFMADRLAEEYRLPERVFPIVLIAMGYPAEDPPVRPRYPLGFTLFRDAYPELTEEQVSAAASAMDEGYLAQGYYRRAGLMLPLEPGRAETFDLTTYSWTEHISRKLGQWTPDPQELLGQLEKRGFRLTGPRP